MTSGLADQGLSANLVLYLSIAALLIGSIALRMTWPEPRFGPADPAEDDRWPGAGLPTTIRTVLHAIGLTALGSLLVIGWLGSEQFGANPIWLAMFTLFWTAGLALSAVIGDWWRLVSPFEPIARWVSGSVRDNSEAAASGQTTDGDSDRTWWVPAGLLLSFLWMHPALGWSDGIRPRNIVLWLTLYTLVMVGGAVWRGTGWVCRHEAFAVLFGLVSTISPLDWTGPGPGPRWRNPLDRIGRRRVDRREAAMLAVLVGSVTFDSIGATKWWVDLVGNRQAWEYTAFKIAGFGWTVLIIGVLWMAWARLAEWLGGPTPGGARSAELALVPALITLAVGFTVAHDLSSFLTDIQNLLALSSDPLAQGWDLLGTTRLLPDPVLIPTWSQVWISIGLVEVSMLVTLVSLHDRCAARYQSDGLGRTVWAIFGLLVVIAVVALRLILKP